MPLVERLRRTVSRSAMRVPARAVLAAAMLTGDALAAGAAEGVAQQTLIDALAPALAARGATAVVKVSPPDARRTLEPCRVEGFLPPGSRLVGRTVVGVRCVDGAGWQAFLSANVRVEAPVWQSTRALRAGDPIAAGDLVLVTAPLAAADVEAAAAVARTASSGAASATRGLATIDGRQPAPLGRTVVRAVAAGRALTGADVREEGRINPGEPVRVIVVGNGFSVASEGRAVGAAEPGGRVTIRLPSGAIVNGTLRADRIVELPY